MMDNHGSEQEMMVVPPFSSEGQNDQGTRLQQTSQVKWKEAARMEKNRMKVVAKSFLRSNINPPDVNANGRLATKKKPLKRRIRKEPVTEGSERVIVATPLRAAVPSAPPTTMVDLHGYNPIQLIHHGIKSVVVVAGPNSGVPEGWLIEYRARDSVKRIDTFYYDPIKWKRFRSLLDVHRYLATGLVKKHDWKSKPSKQ